MFNGDQEITGNTTINQLWKQSGPEVVFRNGKTFKEFCNQYGKTGSEDNGFRNMVSDSPAATIEQERADDNKPGSVQFTQPVVMNTGTDKENFDNKQGLLFVALGIVSGVVLVMIIQKIKK